jgi:hypothetical protein
MRRTTRHVLPAAIAVTALCLVAGGVMGSISGSKHDFADPVRYPTNWSNGQICLPCHAPHNTTPTATDGGELAGPLWNHTLSTNSYKMYTAVLNDPNDVTKGTHQGVTDGNKVDTNSVLCLSCHDGTIALDSFGGATSTTAGAITGRGNLGTDLSNDHPIGAAAEWKEVPYMVSKTLRATAGIMPLRKMDDGKEVVGCTSCHEPHNRKATKFMLWVDNDKPGTTVAGTTVSGSVLCLNCHKK